MEIALKKDNTCVRAWILFSPLLNLHFLSRLIKKDKASSALQTISQRDCNKERVKQSEDDLVGTFFK